MFIGVSTPLSPLALPHFFRIRVIRTVSSLNSSTSASFASLPLTPLALSYSGSSSRSLGISVRRSFPGALAGSAVLAASRLRASRFVFRVRLMLTSSSSSAKMSALAVRSITAPFFVLHTTHCFADMGLLNVHAGQTHFSSGELIVTVTAGSGFAFACVAACACAFSSSRWRRAASSSGLNDCGLRVRTATRDYTLRSKTDAFYS